MAKNVVGSQAARVAEFHQIFDAGKFVFMPTNKGVQDTYGDAVAPLDFISKKWSPHFEVGTYIDDPKKFWQAVLVVQRAA